MVGLASILTLCIDIEPTGSIIELPASIISYLVGSEKHLLYHRTRAKRLLVICVPAVHAMQHIRPVTPGDKLNAILCI